MGRGGHLTDKRTYKKVQTVFTFSLFKAKMISFTAKF